MSQHALLSPSGFKALMLCPAKPAMERGRPDSSSEHADEGTAAHFLGAWCLQHGEQAPLHLGRQIFVHAEHEGWAENFSFGLKLDGRVFTVDEDFAEAVQVYIDTVRDYLGPDGVLFVEQALPIAHVTGEKDAEGTGDAVILRGDELIVIDLKFGRGVEVSAIDNPQLRLYALGALAKFDLVGDIARVRTVICQPRAGGTSEEEISVEQLQAWARDVAAPAAKQASWIYSMVAYDGADPANWCKPHEDACRFCKAKGDCGALDRQVATHLEAEFTDLTTEDQVEREAIVEAKVATAKAAGSLGAKLAAAPLIEIWLKGVRAAAQADLLAGRPVEGFKLVAGKKGARQWTDAQAAETLLRKTFRLKVEDAYDLSLISPTSAEKLLKATPKRWAKAQALITQKDGKPSVAPVSDTRPALEIKPIESEFTPITSEAPATADDLV